MTWCVQIASDVLNKLPVEFELDKIRKRYGLEVTPTTVVLLQELERFNVLITRMRRSLATLKRVSDSSAQSPCFELTWAHASEIIQSLKESHKANSGKEVDPLRHTLVSHSLQYY